MGSDEILVVNAAGRELVYAGEAACRRLGAAGPGELADRWPRLLEGAVGDALARAGCAPGAGSPAPATAAHSHRTSDGVASDVSLEARRVDGPPLDAYVLVVSGASAAESPVPRFERAESKMRVISRLYGSATHDLFGPINAIAVNVELLRQSLSGDGDDPRVEKRRRWLSNVTDDVFRLSRSLRSVLEFASLPKPARVRVDLGEIVEFGATLLRPRAKHQNVAVDASKPPRPVVVRADADFVRHAVLLLGLDALDAMPGGGTLEIEALESAGRALLAVRDRAPADGAPLPSRRDAADSAPSGESLAAARALAASLGGAVLVEPSCRALSLPLEVDGG